MSTLVPKVEARMMRELIRRDVRPVTTQNAPCSRDDLLEVGSMRRAFGATVPLFSGGCQWTIWSTPRVNLAFRALHDLDHLALRAPFTLEGDSRVYRRSLRWARTAFERSALWWEAIGQLHFLRDNGAFPENQRAFVVAGLRSQGYALP